MVRPCAVKPRDGIGAILQHRQAHQRHVPLRRRLHAVKQQHKVAGLAMRLPHHAVPGLAEPDAPGMQPVPQRLVRRDPLREPCLVLRVQLHRIQFDAEMPGERHARPEVQRLPPPRAVGRRRADVRPHHFGRKNAQEFPLHANPLHGVQRVARPEPVRILKDSGINPPAACRAGLDLDLRKRCPQPRHQRVGRLHLPPVDRARPARYDLAVMVPFEVRDRQ